MKALILFPCKGCEGPLQSGPELERRSLGLRVGLDTIEKMSGEGDIEFLSYWETIEAIGEAICSAIGCSEGEGERLARAARAHWLRLC